MKRLIDTVFEKFSFVVTDVDGFEYLEKSRFMALFDVFGPSRNPCKDQKGNFLIEANFTSVELLLSLLSRKSNPQLRRGLARNSGETM